MTVNVTNAGTLVRVGPGYVLFWSISAGPIPVDDYIIVAVSATPFSNPMCSSYHPTKGFLSGRVVLGVTDVPNALSATAFNGMDAYLAPGSGCELTIVHNHASGVEVQRNSYSTLLWDPVNSAFALGTEAISRQSSASGTKLDQILRAVIRVWP